MEGASLAVRDLVDSLEEELLDKSSPKQHEDAYRFVIEAAACKMIKDHITAEEEWAAEQIRNFDTRQAVEKRGVKRERKDEDKDSVMQFSRVECARNLFNTWEDRYFEELHDWEEYGQYV